ncbi:MAG: DUF2786 domain-containing protein [Labilithrix sp.]|nr:DUF2786 domain-containing protein [Labilithrix sp.]
MKNVVERVEQLIALATSPNENEARNAAMLAVQLIRKHRLVLSIPAANAGSSARARTKSDSAREAQQPSSGRKRSRSSKGNKRVVDPPEKIVAPLGGECVHCGSRYRADTTIYWFASGGGMHPKCFEEWSAR